MKKIIQKLILTGFTVVTLFGFASNVSADNLDVTFTPNPLFSQSNFLPMDVISGTVAVTNNSGTTQNILTEAINVSDADNFGSLLNLTISGGTPYSDSLADFFSTAGEVPLGSISNGESKTFTNTISFSDSSDNTYQGKTLGFDICVGFEGGTTHCGDTVTSPENGGGGPGDPPGGGSNSGSGSSGSIILQIFNEQALNISNVGNSGEATITWDTNKLATSQVIYGPVPGPYTLDLNLLPNLGYPLGTSEDPTKVLHHSMLLTGLTPGETYLYRVVSHASPATVSFEHQFTVPLTGPLARAPGNNFTGGTNPSSGNNGTGTGEILGASVEEDTQVEDNSTGNNSEGNVNVLAGSTLLSGFNNLLSICTLIGILILLAFYIIWKLWLRKKFEERGLTETQIQEKFFELFGGFALLSALISIIIKDYCILPIFLIVFVISLVVYFIRKIK